MCKSVPSFFKEDLSNYLGSDTSSYIFTRLIMYSEIFHNLTQNVTLGIPEIFKTLALFTKVELFLKSGPRFCCPAFVEGEHIVIC